MMMLTMPRRFHDGNEHGVVRMMMPDPPCDDDFNIFGLSPSSSTSKRQCHSQLRLWSRLAKSLDVYKICNRMGFRCFFLSKLSFCDKSLLLFFCEDTENIKE